MSQKTICHLLLVGAALSLTACLGGGSGNSGLAITPAPLSPPPPSARPNALSSPPAGITATTSFATEGAELKIRWNAEVGAYEVTVPGYASAKAVPDGEAVGKLVASDGTTLPFSLFARPNTAAWEPYRYTSWVEVTPIGADRGSARITAYGVPTALGSVPTVGSATYTGEINGRGDGLDIYGNAAFNFDFAAGTLSGYMDPKFSTPMDAPPDLPRYNFSQTVFSPGSTTFSGRFDITGPTPSFFNGRFTGPSAEELMAQWQAPFQSWGGKWATMEGVMIAKRK